FSGSASNSEFLVPAVDLSACFPDAAARFVRAHGGLVHEGLGVRGLTIDAGRPTLHTASGSQGFDAVTVAVGPHQLASTIRPERAADAEWREALALVAAFRYESITTIYLGLDRRIALATPLLRLDDAPGQWLFDCAESLARSAHARTAGLVAIVISAGGAH